MKPFLLFLSAALLVQAADDRPLFSEIPAMEESLSQISGLRFLHEVPYGTLTKDQLRKSLEERIRKTIKPAELRAEELTLKMLGLVPQDFDLRQNTVDLLTEQAAAFYDYNKKKLFILEGSSAGTDDRIALVHELAHALADQHFRLAKYIREGERSDDGSTARLAVMEGQATWLMTAYMSKLNGGPPEVPTQLLDQMTANIATSADQYPVFSKAPPYIRESLVFPYTQGMLFQNAVFRKLGRDSFAEVFVHPPASTHQILHPDTYLNHQSARLPDPPPVPAAREFRKLEEGSLGEQDYRVLLSQYSTKEEGSDAAAHLEGSSYQLLEQKHDKYPVLTFASTWDSADAAQKYIALYRRVMQGKWNSVTWDVDTATKLEGRGDSGRFRLWLDGNTVNQLEGLH
jgi:hypothetical protein